MIKGEIIIKKRLFCLKHNKKNYRKKTGKGKKRRKTQEESTTDTLDNFWTDTLWSSNQSFKQKTRTKF